MKRELKLAVSLASLLLLLFLAAAYVVVSGLLLYSSLFLNLCDFFSIIIF